MTDVLNSRDEKQSSNITPQHDVFITFQVKFFAMRCLASFPWSILELELQSAKSTEVLLEILNRTCLHSICRKNPPSNKYRRLFLSELIKRHEAATTEPLDELYEALGDVLGLEEQSVCYKSYFLPSGNIVSLSESVANISEGTTGLVTWEAAMYLAEWALENPHVFCGRSVLELGSGMGLTGTVVCKSCNPGRYAFSDCHPSVLARLQENLQLNGLVAQGGLRVSVEELDWESVTEKHLQKLQADTVIAADVVYDPDLVGCLVRLLSKLLKSKIQDCHPSVYISSTIRNPDTYSSFKSQLGKAGIKHQIITAAVTQVFPYDRTSTIEIVKLYL